MSDRDLLFLSMTTAVQGSAMTGAGPMVFSIDQSRLSGGHSQSPKRMSGDSKIIREDALCELSATKGCTRTRESGFVGVGKKAEMCFFVVCSPWLWLL
ncbi:MAG: hypothetical protein ED559_00025 [Phycisphaera sp.]|nr:MAG: hypothetical protein ED559_00025 [Phycisphaera sp.]